MSEKEYSKPTQGSFVITCHIKTGKHYIIFFTDLCSHDRSWRYYVESLALPTAFMAASATNVDEWVANNGHTNQTIYIGDLTSPRWDMMVWKTELQYNWGNRGLLLWTKLLLRKVVPGIFLYISVTILTIIENKKSSNQ